MKQEIDNIYKPNSTKSVTKTKSVVILKPNIQEYLLKLHVEDDSNNIKKLILEIHNLNIGNIDNFYQELFFKFKSFIILYELFDSLKFFKFKISSKILIPMVNSAYTDEHLYLLYFESKQRNLIDNVKIIDCFVRKTTSHDFITMLISDLVVLNIKPDHRLIEYIASNNECDINIINNVITYFEKANTIVSSIKKGHWHRVDWDEVHDDNIFTIVLYNLTNYHNIKLLIENIPINKRTSFKLFKLLEKLQYFDFSDEIFELLNENIIPFIDSKKLARVINVGKKVIYSGKLKLYSKMFSYSEILKAKIDNTHKNEKYYYLCGKRQTYLSELSNFFIDKIQIERDISEIIDNGWRDLFESDICFKKGQLDAIEELKDVYFDVKTIKYPLIILFIIENPEFYNSLIYSCYNNLFIRFEDVEEINNEISGFQIFTDFEEISKFISFIDLSKNDVCVVHFYSGKNSAKIRYDQFHTKFNQEINSYKIHLEIQNLNVDIDKSIKELIRAMIM